MNSLDFYTTKLSNSENDGKMDKFLYSKVKTKDLRFGNLIHGNTDTKIYVVI